MSGLVDSHCHLEMLRAPVEAVLTEARDAGVAALVSIGTDLASTRTAIELAHRYHGVYATTGLHPHDAKRMDDRLLDELERAASDEKVVAVGECGLDFYRNLSPRDDQRRAFVAQIGLARRARLPLVVHTREAAAETFALLAEHAAGLDVVMHCFAAPEFVEECSVRGYYVSFAGNLTYKNAANLRGAAREVREDRLLVETDAPFLSPMPHRGKQNTPARVALTAACLADLRGCDAARVAAVTAANARRVFRLPEEP